MRSGLTHGGGSVQSGDFFKAIDRRIERTLMRTVSTCTHSSCPQTTSWVAHLFSWWQDTLLFRGFVMLVVKRVLIVRVFYMVGQENGSYQQRVLTEYIREIETRAQALIAAFRSSPPNS